MYGRTDVWTDVWKFTPVSYRTSALWGRCPKRRRNFCICESIGHWPLQGRSPKRTERRKENRKEGKKKGGKEGREERRKGGKKEGRKEGRREGVNEYLTELTIWTM